jgi:hypothetical protein
MSFFEIEVGSVKVMPIHLLKIWTNVGNY